MFLKKIVLGARKLLQGKGFCTAKSYEGLSEEEEQAVESANARVLRLPTPTSKERSPGTPVRLEDDGEEQATARAVGVRI